MRGAKIVEKMKMQSLDKVAENIRNVEAFFQMLLQNINSGGGNSQSR